MRQRCLPSWNHVNTGQSPDSQMSGEDRSVISKMQRLRTMCASIPDAGISDPRPKFRRSATLSHRILSPSGYCALLSTSSRLPTCSSKSRAQPPIMLLEYRIHALWGGVFVDNVVLCFLCSNKSSFVLQNIAQWRRFSVPAARRHELVKGSW